MLWADKRALETNLKVQLLQIRERELEFYVRNTLTICVVATIILGFSYTMMTEAVPSDYAGWGRTPCACCTWCRACRRSASCSSA